MYTPHRTMRIESANTGENASRVLVIYTGGTFGMVYEPKGRQLVPFDFTYALDYLPELSRMECEITFLSLHQPIDSSDMTPAIWLELVRIIADRYRFFDSFVILHGTDTMAYTASALSYLLENLSKPVILTGAQLPVGVARSDARENLLTALEIAGGVAGGKPLVSEVCIYFNSLLLRGNRAQKKETSQFNAFYSNNYPVLANAGVRIEFNHPYLKQHTASGPLLAHDRLDTDVALFKLFPGMNERIIRAVLRTEGLKGLVLETYGAGNAPNDPVLLSELRAAIDRGLIVFNVTQCEGGRVVQGQYGSSKYLSDIGVVSGADITVEAGITKLMFLLGRYSAPEEVRRRLAVPICGEMSE